MTGELLTFRLHDLGELRGAPLSTATLPCSHATDRPGRQPEADEALEQGGHAGFVASIPSWWSLT